MAYLEKKLEIYPIDFDILKKYEKLFVNNNPVFNYESHCYDCKPDDSEKKDCKIPIWNFREWEILSWCRSRINIYKNDKGDPEKLRDYKEAKRLWKKVMNGDYNNSQNNDNALEERSSVVYGSGLNGRVQL